MPAPWNFHGYWNLVRSREEWDDFVRAFCASEQKEHGFEDWEMEHLYGSEEEGYALREPDKFPVLVQVPYQREMDCDIKLPMAYTEDATRLISGED